MPNALRTDEPFSRVPRRGAVALVTTVLALILLFNFNPGNPPNGAETGPTAAVIGAPGSTFVPGVVPIGPEPTAGSSPGTGAATIGPGTSGAGARTGTGTFTGSVIRTPYGNVQVAAVLKDGTIVDVQALQLPSDRRLSQQINDYAAPLLRDEVLAAQSANIDGISGATYTSEGYFASLQSALAQVP